MLEIDCLATPGVQVAIVLSYGIPRFVFALLGMLCQYSDTQRPVDSVVYYGVTMLLLRLSFPRSASAF